MESEPESMEPDKRSELRAVSVARGGIMYANMYKRIMRRLQTMRFKRHVTERTTPCPRTPANAQSPSSFNPVSYNAPRLQNENRCNNTADQENEAQPKRPTYPRPLFPLAALAFEPRISV